MRNTAGNRLISITSDEKSNGALPGSVFANIRTGRRFFQCVHERAEMKFPPRIKKVDCGRRQKWMLSILRYEIVWCKESDNRQECGKEDKTTENYSLMFQNGSSYWARILGSTRNSRKSANKLPAIRKIVPNMTVSTVK